MKHIQNDFFFRFYENVLELFKSGLLFDDLRTTRKALSKAKLEELQVYLRHLPRCFAIFVSTDSVGNSICHWFSRKLKSRTL